MNILLLLISLIFWVIFYSFYLLEEEGTYLVSLSWNLIIETIIFFIIWFFLFFSFSNFSFEEKNKSIPKKYKLNINFNVLLKLIQLFVKKYLYYIWIIFLYVSFYIILKYYWYTNFSYFILFLNIVVLLLFFITNKFLLFRDFIKINTIIFSLYYIIVFVISLFFHPIFLWKIDTLNTILVFSFFILTFYNDKNLLNNKKSDLALTWNFFIYSFLFLIYYLKNYIWNIALSIEVVSIFLFSFIYFFITKINFFKNNVKLLKVISILISYISIFSAFYLLSINEYVFISLLNIFYIAIFNVFIHYKYQNYISFLIFFLWIIYIVFYFYFKNLYLLDSWFIFLWLWLGLSLELIIYTYFYNLKYKQDYYFIHIISYLISFFTIVYYFYHFSFDLLVLGIILFVIALIALLSYFKLNKIEIN